MVCISEEAFINSNPDQSIEWDRTLERKITTGKPCLQQRQCLLAIDADAPLNLDRMGEDRYRVLVLGSNIDQPLDDRTGDRGQIARQNQDRPSTSLEGRDHAPHGADARVLIAQHEITSRLNLGGTGTNGRNACAKDFAKDSNRPIDKNLVLTTLPSDRLT